jgi:ABC-type multidrug transport system ATPase subunit
MSFEHLVKSFNVSYLPQRGRLFPELTISENLTVAGFDSSSLLDTVAADLHLRADEAVANLSGGEVLRLAITITELRRAQLVFLDEPTDSADKETKRRVLEILKVFRKHGSTVVVVDHDISFLRASCDILGEVKDAMDESLPHGYTIEFCDINR